MRQQQQQQGLQQQQVFLLLLLLFCTTTASVIGGGDWFDTLDTNHDGSINRQEYQDGVAKLTAALNGPVPTSSSSSSPFSIPSLDAFLPSHLVEGGFWKGTWKSFLMILATEIGDKTFFIAAVLSMRQDRSMVFGGAILALIIMTILSTVMGLVLPSILPKEYTHILGGLLFLYFGVKLLVESRSMEDNKVSEELEEVEEELLHPKKDDATNTGGGVIIGGDEEDGKKLKKSSSSVGSSSKPSSSSSSSAVVAIFMQSLTLTFLAEWGDRSQIATIALAASNNPYGVTIGGCLGHSLCTGLAVLGGRMLAARISEKKVAFYGGLIFLGFGLHSFFFE